MSSTTTASASGRYFRCRFSFSREVISALLLLSTVPLNSMSSAIRLIAACSPVAAARGAFLAIREVEGVVSRALQIVFLICRLRLAGRARF